MNIDWSKAPSWAYAYAQIIYNHQTSAKDFAWICRDGYRVALPDDSREECWPFTEGTFTADRFRILEFRPDLSPWTGEGLPPIGIVCEVLITSALGKREWREGKIIHRCRTSAAVAHGPELGLVEWGHGFRPIRTPEQIAAEEREASAVDLFRSVMNSPKSCSWYDLGEERREHYRHLIDQGWQKVPRA